MTSQQDPSKGFKKAFDDAAERGETRCSVCLSTAHSKEYHENAAVQGQAGVSAERKIQEVQELVDLLPHGDCTAQKKMADCLRCRITDRLAALAAAPPKVGSE